MKKSLVTIAVASSVFMMSGCAGNNEPAPQKIVKTEKVERKVVYQKQTATKEEIKVQDESEIYNSLPHWVHNPDSVEDGVGAMGVAEKSKYRTVRDVIRIAQHDARVKLAKQVLVSINAEFNDALEEGITNDHINVEKAVKNNSQEIAKNVRLSGAKQINSFAAKDGNFYVHMKISNKIVKQGVKKGLRKLEQEMINSAQSDIAREEIKKNMNLIKNKVYSN
ncbi:MAG: hypothetical protein U9N59_15915 [Campylobacterota bacterium]|nr:hypothetical protein [Campylobacterota bacterium]